MTKDDQGNNPSAEGGDENEREFVGSEYDELDEMQWLPELIDQSSLMVPDELHSCFSNEPFQHCIECGCNVLNGGTTYVIQKARRDGETVLELAICMNCAQSMQDGMSEESREAMEEFLGGLMPRSEDHQDGTCLSCGCEVDQAEDEYEIAGLALGPILLTPVILFCVACHEELEQNLSEETRKGGEDFIEKNFPGIPADLGLPISFLGT